jgi:stearoyl-CoA 9-desaturase NADPH oxidoreductase
MTTATTLARACRTAGRTAAERLFLHRQAEFWLGELSPVRSLGEIRARVVRVVDETADVKTFVLRPNARWRGHRAGQYTTVEVEQEGVRVRRCYSISSAPGDALVSLTVKRVPGGRVSGWLHEQLRPGSVVRLSAAAGDFVLPEPVPARLLFFSAGSGVTPVMAMLRELAARDAVGDVVFVHHARTRADVIFAAELERLAARHPGLRLLLCVGAEARFDEARFAALVPDFAARAAFVCAPVALMDRVERLCRDAGGRVQRERFVSAPLAPARAGAVKVRLMRAQRGHELAQSGTLLDELERAGERPAHGCRMGICHTCKCRKRAGAVLNLLTGELSTRPDEEIQLCVSVPRSDLELEL